MAPDYCTLRQTDYSIHVANSISSDMREEHAHGYAVLQICGRRALGETDDPSLTQRQMNAHTVSRHRQAGGAPSLSQHWWAWSTRLPFAGTSSSLHASWIVSAMFADGLMRSSFLKISAI